MRMKTVRPGRAEVVHVETALGVVNIYVGLEDAQGRRVERVEMLPNRYVGEPLVVRDGNRFVEHLGKNRKGVNAPTGLKRRFVYDKQTLAEFTALECKALMLFDWFENDPRPGIIRAVKSLREELSGLMEAKEFCDGVRVKLMNLLKDK